jgi:predicted LPLAT superfamily acyltransferase
VSFAYFFLRFVAAYFLLFSFNSVKSLYYFYHSRLGFSSVSALIAVYRNFYTFGQVLLDKVSMFNGFNHRVTQMSVGAEHLNKIRDMEKGGIMICAHFGGWELSGHLMEELGFRPKILMLQREHEKIKHLIEASSLQRKLDIIPIKDDLSHILRVTDALKNKKLIALHGDRFIQGIKTIRLPFLGKEADFPMGPFALAVQLNVPVSFVFTTREKGLQYRCSASPIHLPFASEHQSNRQERIRTLAIAYVKTLEDHVKKYPYQWFNYYDFWQKGDCYAPN